jgi:ABC-type multidrug transport system fused ATPase/permease subunit
LELLGGCMILICAVFLVAGRKVVDPGTVGLALSYALQITGLLNMTVRLAAVTENSFNAVERVQEYAAVGAEKVDAPTGAPQPPPNWPSHGAISFEGVSMKYREHEKLVLNGLDFAVNPGQKIGIVGRTGAGKSSAFLTLFRIVEPCGGTIKIDGIDISSLSLHALRSKLSIIPQDPVLFTGMSSLLTGVSTFSCLVLIGAVADFPSYSHLNGVVHEQQALSDTTSTHLISTMTRACTTRWNAPI